MAARARPITRQYESSIGSTVELKYVIQPDDTALIVSYRRRKRGMRNFTRVRDEEGRTVPLAQLPWHKRTA